jgi:hypothetical protein
MDGYRKKIKREKESGWMDTLYIVAAHANNNSTPIVG